MSNPHSTAQIAGHPIHPMLVPFPIAFFTATLVCDLVYRQSGNEFWFTATQYLLGAGIVMALLAALAGFTDFFSDGRIRAISIAWWHMLGNLLLSLVGVLIMLFTGWLGWEMVYRKRVAIAEEGKSRDVDMHHSMPWSGKA